MKAAISPSKEQMVKLGMPEFTVEDFYDNFMETLDTLGGAEKISSSDLDTTFNEEGVSNYLVVFLRYDHHSFCQAPGPFHPNYSIPSKASLKQEAEVNVLFEVL